MKRLMGWLLIFVLGAAAGGGAMVVFGRSGLGPTAAAAAAFNPRTAVTVTESSVQSNLAGGTHYVRFTVQFTVSPQALVAAGGTVAGAKGGAGTGSAQLDGEIQQDLVELARATSYTAVTSAGSMSTFRRMVKVVLESVFGNGTIGQVYFPSFLTQ